LEGEEERKKKYNKWLKNVFWGKMFSIGKEPRSKQWGGGERV